MTISEAQADLRRAYTDGGPGVIISGLVWIAAYFATTNAGVETGFAVLFFGGMAIFPLALLINRSIIGRQKESPDNPYGILVLEGTIAMIAMLFAAWLFLPLKPELVFPLAAIAVGTHYFVFQTAYGMKAFWLLAAIVALVGFNGIYRFFPLPGDVVLLVGLVEFVFGAVLTFRAMRSA